MASADPYVSAEVGAPDYEGRNAQALGASRTAVEGSNAVFVRSDRDVSTWVSWYAVHTFGGGGGAASGILGGAVAHISRTSSGVSP